MSLIKINDSKLKEIRRKKLKGDEEEQLEALTHTLADGTVIQVRPQDLENFRVAIALGMSEDWLTLDNKTRQLSVAEMQECLDSGIQQAKAIKRAYVQAVKELGN